MEARIALCKCREGRNIYGVRFEKLEDGWKYTWAFPVKKLLPEESSMIRQRLWDRLFLTAAILGVLIAGQRILSSVTVVN